MIKYGWLEFSTSKLYRIADTIDDPRLRRRRVWVQKMVWNHSSFLQVRLADTNELVLVRPWLVVVDR